MTNYKTMYEIRLGDKCYVKDTFTEHMLDYLCPTPYQTWADAFKKRLRGEDDSPLSYCIERLEIGAWDRAYEGKANEKEVHDACVQLLKDCPNNVPELRLVVYNVSE